MEYWLNTVTYGTASEFFLAIITLIELATPCVAKYPSGAHASLKQFYVDAIFGRANDKYTGPKIRNELLSIMATVTHDAEWLREGVSDKDDPHFTIKLDKLVSN